MRIAFTADTHFHNYTEFGATTVEPFTGLPINSRLLDQLTTFWRMCNKAKSLDVSHLVINGDLFHIRGSVPTDVYQFVYMYLDKIVNELGIQVHILVGNHDQADKSGSIHSVYGLRRLVKVYDTPEQALIGDVTIAFIPYLSDKASLLQALDEAKPSDILLAHCGVDGATVGPIEYKIKDPVTVDLLHPEKHGWVLLGHYHKPQKLAKNVVYIGSPAQVNRGEAGELKTWILYDSQMPVDCSRYKTRAKEFISMTDEDFLAAPVEELTHYFDVHVSHPELLAAVQEKSHGLSVKIIPVVVEQDTKARISKAQDMTDEELLTAYIEHQGGTSAKKLLELGVQLLQKGAVGLTSNTRLSFLRLVINNFMVIGHADLKLHSPGSVIAIMADNQTSEGFTSNGGGKSSLLPESIFWCLWGVTARELPADKVVNRKRKRDCSVQLLLLAGNRKLDVTRYRKHKILGGDGLRLIIDGKDVTEGTPKLTQERLNKELGVDYTTFSSVMAFSPDTLRFVQDTDSNQKHVLDSILQTRRFTAALEVAKKALSITKSARLSLSQEADASRTALESLQALATRYDELNASWEQREQDRVAGLLESIDEEESNRGATEQVLKTLKDAETEMAATYHTTKTEYDDLPDYEADLLAITAALAECRATIRAREEQRDEIADKLEAAVEQAGKPCPTCGQKVSNTGTLIANYQSERNRLDRELAQMRLSETQFQETQKQYTDIRDTHKRLSKELSELKLKLDAKKRSVTATETKVTQHNCTIGNLQAQVDDKPVNDYDVLIPETAGKIQEESAKLEGLEKALRGKDIMTDRIQFWVTGFGGSGIRSFLLDCILPTLTNYANDFSEQLSGGNIHIGFQSHKEGVATDKFMIQAWNEDGSDIYKGNSSGEKRRIDVCILLALFRIANNRTKFNLLLLDEVLDTLDESGIEHIAELLFDMAKTLNLTVYVTSHNDSLVSRLHESLTIVKKDGVSTLEGR